MGSCDEQDPKWEAQAWIPCRGLSPLEPGESQTDASKLVQHAALEALQAMQEEGAQHAEEVAKLLDEPSDSLVQEALKTLCLLAPASPRNAYKRCAPRSVACPEIEHLSPLVRLLG